jgi:ubiquinone/menaquinone biosynthesis C-methylase UbiE
MAEYDTIASDYESKVVPKFRPIAERLAALAGPRPGDHVLELGAGTGGLSRLVLPRIEPGGHLVLLDISTGMLEVATRVLRDEGYQNATCVVHDLAALPFLDEQFDLVLCNLGYFEESQRAVHEALRVLRRGGRLAIAIWGPLTTHDEWPILRAARRELGLSTQFVPPVGDVIKRLTRAGFTRLRRQHEHFTVTHQDVDAYVSYRESFPWRTIVATPASRSRYLARLRREAGRRASPDGRLAIRWSVTFLMARRGG